MTSRFPADQTPCEGYCWPDGCPPSQPCHAAYMRLDGGAEGALRQKVASHYEQTGRDLAALGYTVGRWTNDVRHVEPCDCDLDEERVGDCCMDNSPSYWALMRDEGAHGWSMAFPIDADLVDALREWFEAEGGSMADRQKAREGLHAAWDSATRDRETVATGPALGQDTPRGKRREQPMNPKGDN